MDDIPHLLAQLAQARRERDLMRVRSLGSLDEANELRREHRQLREQIALLFAANPDAFDSLCRAAGVEFELKL